MRRHTYFFFFISLPFLTEYNGTWKIYKDTLANLVDLTAFNQYANIKSNTYCLVRTKYFGQLLLALQPFDVMNNYYSCFSQILVNVHLSINIRRKTLSSSPVRCMTPKRCLKTTFGSLFIIMWLAQNTICAFVSFALFLLLLLMLLILLLKRKELTIMCFVLYTVSSYWRGIYAKQWWL